MNVIMEIEDERGQDMQEVVLPVVLGREADCDVRLSDPCVSRRHCQIECSSEETLIICDLGSKNGTFVDGEKVEETALAPTARLGIGNTKIHVYPTRGWRQKLRRLVPFHLVVAVRG